MSARVVEAASRGRALAVWGSRTNMSAEFCSINCKIGCVSFAIPLASPKVKAGAYREQRGLLQGHAQQGRPRRDLRAAGGHVGCSQATVGPLMASNRWWFGLFWVSNTQLRSESCWYAPVSSPPASRRSSRFCENLGLDDVTNARSRKVVQSNQCVVSRALGGSSCRCQSAGSLHRFGCSAGQQAAAGSKDQQDP